MARALPRSPLSAAENAPMIAADYALDPGIRVHLIRGDEVKPEPIRWLWDGWLAKGKLHVLAGPPGTGKTTLAVALAAAVTQGSMWPDGSRAPTGDVLLFSAEDDVKDTLAPRLIAAGADMKRVWFIDQVAVVSGGRTFDPATDLELLEERLSEMELPALLIVDPIVNAVAGDSHKNGEVRRALAPLVALAERYDVAVLGISHFSKGTGGRDPTERVTGSIAFGALARVVMAAVKGKPNEDGTESDRLFVRTKSNIGRDDGGFAYALEQVPILALEGIEASVVRWRGPLEGSARELLAAAEVRPDDEMGSALREAEEFLLDLLAPGPVPASKVQEQARAAGHSMATVRRAKGQLDVQARKLGMAGGWAWSLSEGNQGNAKRPTQNSTGTFGINDPLRGVDDSEALE